MQEILTVQPRCRPSLPAPASAPDHVAIVPDGNRRWARRTGATTAEAYVAAAHKALEAADWCRAAGVRHLSAFALSQENLAMRPPDDVEAIRRALFVFFDGLRARVSPRLHLFGDLAALSTLLPTWRTLLPYDDAPLDSELTVHLGINYSGRAEIAAIARAAMHGARVDNEALEAMLLSSGVPDVDLVLRAGGQQRLSGFLPFQTAYAELWFTPTLWPDVTRRDFDAALAWYAQQERRLGE